MAVICRVALVIFFITHGYFRVPIIRNNLKKSKFKEHRVGPMSVYFTPRIRSVIYYLVTR